MSELDNTITKFEYKFAFKQDDWFLNVVLGNEDIRYRIFIIKNYNANLINSIVFDIYSLVKEERTKLENKSVAFINKKNYLTLNSNSDKIQITLEDEYALKELIERYKAYELIGWIHLGKNEKIFKHCIIQKNEILKKMYPIVDLSMRKVIGAKVISPTEIEFEDAVNNAWLNIIKYITKIDTSRVMFSVFVKVAHLSAIRFKNNVILPHKYNTVNMSDLVDIGDSDSSISEDVFINTVMANNPDIDYSFTDIEDDMIDSIDIDNNVDAETVFYIESANKELNDIIDSLENNEKPISPLYQNVLSYSYNILSGKVKRICHEKIFAEFFIDLINQNISDSLILKHTPVILDIMSTASTNPIIEDDIRTNGLVYKMFKDWIKDKIKFKIDRYREMNPSINSEQIAEVVDKENRIYEFLRNNKNNILTELITYKRKCNNFQL